MRFILIVTTLAVALAANAQVVLDRPAGPNPDMPVTQPAAAIPSQEERARTINLIVSGEVTVNHRHSGEVTVRHQYAAAGVSRKRAQQLARHEAAISEARARNHADQVAQEALRKANAYTDEKSVLDRQYADNKIDSIKPSIATAANWGKWGVGIALTALIIGFIGWFLPRRRGIYRAY